MSRNDIVFVKIKKVHYNLFNTWTLRWTLRQPLVNSEALPTCLLSACVVWVRRTVGMPHRGVCAPRTHTSSIYVSAAWRLARRHRPPLAHHHLAPKEHYAVALAYLQGAKKCANFQSPGKTIESPPSLMSDAVYNSELNEVRGRCKQWRAKNGSSIGR